MGGVEGSWGKAGGRRVSQRQSLEKNARQVHALKDSYDFTKNLVKPGSGQVRDILLYRF